MPALGFLTRQRLRRCSGHRLLLSLWSAARRGAGSAARVRGTIRAQSGRPLADARVANIGGDSTVTDGQGSFVLRVATGRSSPFG
ncbi:MAG: carboxypeptidase regulatory-like domain-containing protein [Gemmatimonadetes bacterium]|nr:carboxypeptidase regulatory-like domain-containing protein [Gemmatimonadota bacterium]